MDRPVITIEAHEIPSGKFSLGIVEPTFEDRRLASKRMPAANSGQRVGYSVTQLMLAMCVKEVNGQPVPFDAKDPVKILRELPTEDTQFLSSTFVSAFTIDNNLSEDIKELATHLKETSKTLSYTIPKHKMPSQMGSITFRRPKTNDEINIQRVYPGEENNPGYTTSEAFFAECIESIDGKPVEKPKDKVTLFDPWTLIDQQYAQGVFNNMAYMDTEGYDNAEQLGKSLRDRLKSTKPLTSKAEKSTKRTTKSNTALSDL